MQKQVKIINMRADKFGIFQAVELDFTKFKNGVLAIKGHAGEGKSTVQKAIKMSTQGRKTIADAETYGDEWEIETQLIDGDRKIFVGAYKKKGKNEIEFKLFEKDINGKKTFTPVIDGEKATPANYMNLISTELTFGIKDFLSENNTVHKKFMFALFRPELELLGVIFDKNNPKYENSILGQLDALTSSRDSLRNKCTHMGAFVTDFNRDGYEIEEIAAYERVDIAELNKKHTDLLINKGKASGDASVEFERLRGIVAKKGQDIVEEVRKKSDLLNKNYYEVKTQFDENRLAIIDKIKSKIRDLNEDYAAKLSDFKTLAKSFEDCKRRIHEIDIALTSFPFIGANNDDQIFGLKRDLVSFISGLESENEEHHSRQTEPIKPNCPEFEGSELKTDQPKVAPHVDFMPMLKELVVLNDTKPTKPICPEIVNGKLSVVAGTVYHADFLPLIQRYNEVGQEYMAIKEPEIDNEAIEAEIAKVAADIQAATQRNLLIDRYELNREWVAADAQVTIKRKELAQLYAQVNTGVPGLRMKPFFDDDKGTSDIKTVYTGEYDLNFFKPRLREMSIDLIKTYETDNFNAELLDAFEVKKDLFIKELNREQLLIGYSSTQMPIIGVLLQVARLKLKEKVLPYIFIDDVPMDRASRAVITDIAEKNGLIIITSITGDFNKEKLTENELLIEGGEVFFS